jgi:hypothetical protein
MIYGLFSIPHPSPEKAASILEDRKKKLLLRILVY